MTGDARDRVRWHDLECGGYAVDLGLWRELAAAADGPVLDVGAGTGRVALDLARHGVRVTALDVDGALLAELAARAGAEGLDVPVLEADAREGIVDGSGQLVLALVRELEAAVSAVEHVRAGLPEDTAVPVASSGW